MPPCTGAQNEKEVVSWIIAVSGTGGILVTDCWGGGGDCWNIGGLLDERHVSIGDCWGKDDASLLFSSFRPLLWSH